MDFNAPIPIYRQIADAMRPCSSTALCRPAIKSRQCGNWRWTSEG
jgi:hypothetical protein